MTTTNVCYVHVSQFDPPSSVRVWLPDTPSVSVTTTEYRPRSSLSGLVKVSLELRNKHTKRKEFIFSSLTFESLSGLLRHALRATSEDAQAHSCLLANIEGEGFMSLV